MIHSSPFTFPGLWPYIEQAAGDRNLRHLGRGRNLWHAKQVQDALAQLPGLAPDVQAEVLAHVAEVRSALSTVVEGIDRAVQDSIRSLNLETPPTTPRLATTPQSIPVSRRSGSAGRHRSTSS